MAGAKGEAKGERPDVVVALRDASKTGVIAFFLFLPLIGFLTLTDMNNALVLTTRWPLLFSWVAAIFLGRFFISLVFVPWMARRAMHPSAGPASWRVFIGRWFIPFAIGFAIAYPVIVIFAGGYGSALK